MILTPNNMAIERILIWIILCLLWSSLRFQIEFIFLSNHHHHNHWISIWFRNNESICNHKFFVENFKITQWNSWNFDQIKKATTMSFLFFILDSIVCIWKFMTQPEELKLLKDDHCCSIFCLCYVLSWKKVHRDKMNSRRMNRQEEKKNAGLRNHMPLPIWLGLVSLFHAHIHIHAFTLHTRMPIIMDSYRFYWCPTLFRTNTQQDLSILLNEQCKNSVQRWNWFGFVSLHMFWV